MEIAEHVVRYSTDDVSGTTPRVYNTIELGNVGNADVTVMLL